MDRLFVCSLALFLAPLPVAATTLDFRHVAFRGWAPSVQLDGLTVQTGIERAVRAIRNVGLGVRSPGDDGRPDRSDQIDSLGANEVVVLRFDHAVRLERISFSGTEWWDRFDLYLGDDLSFHRTLKVDDLSGYDWVSSIGLGAGHVGTSFAIGASQYTSCGYSIAEGHACWTEDSAFHITSVTYSAVEPIPLPSTALLLLSGLASAGLAARARRALGGVQ